MRSILIIILLITANRLLAQPAFGSDRNLTITTAQAVAISSGDISSIRLLLPAQQQQPIGYIPDISGNGTRRLFADSGWAGSFISTRYGKTFREAGKPLTWHCRNISVTTDTSGQFYFVHLTADLYTTESKDAVVKIGSIDTTVSGNLAADNFSPGIQTVFDAALNHSVMGISQPGQTEQHSAQQKQTLAELQQSVVVSEAVSDSKNMQLTRGIYASFAECLENRPSWPLQVWFEADPRSAGKVKLKFMAEDSTITEIKQAWGIALGGEELYKYHNGTLIPIERTAGGFMLSRYQEPAIRKNQALSWRRVAVNAWPADTNPFSRDKAVPVAIPATGKRNTNKVQPVATRIDMSTGELSF